jgi:hypothetical protein
LNSEKRAYLRPSESAPEINERDEDWVDGSVFDDANPLGNKLKKCGINDNLIGSWISGVKSLKGNVYEFMVDKRCAGFIFKY